MGIDKNAKIIWDFMQMNMPLQKADAIFVLCSHDTRVAERASDIYHAGYAPWVIVSGGAGRLTKNVFDKPEAEVFKGGPEALHGTANVCYFQETAAEFQGSDIRYVSKIVV